MPERILVLRSARDNLLGYACRILRERYPRAELLVLAQPAHAVRARAVAGVTATLDYAGERFCPEQLSADLRARLRAVAFREVVILYHNRGGEGYAPVHALVREFHRGRVATVDAAGRYAGAGGRWSRLLADVLLVLRALRAAL